MKLWLVYCDFNAGQEAYATVTGLVGIFDTEEKAKAAAEATWKRLNELYSFEDLTNEEKDKIRQKYIIGKCIEENHVYGCDVYSGFDDFFASDLLPGICLCSYIE